jgi:hypothetical protein
MLRLRICALLCFVLLVTGAAGNSHAEIIVFNTSLSGAAEEPPNTSPGTGTATVTWDTITHLMRVEATFSGLLANTTAAHIHATTALPGQGTAGVATQTPSFSGFPLGVTFGSMDNTFDMTLASSYNPAFVTASGGVPQAEAALFAALNDGKAYFNIHSTQFPAGEIRGFLAGQPAIPEPSTVCLLGMGAVGLLGFAWRRKRQAK